MKLNKKLFYGLALGALMVPGVAVMADDGGRGGEDRDSRVRFDDDRRFFRPKVFDDRRFFLRNNFDDRFFFRNHPFVHFGDDDLRFRFRVDD
ncbi:MAG: hypothetical protein WC745_01405 [Patescibacteria group bacterium]